MKTLCLKINTEKWTTSMWRIKRFWLKWKVFVVDLWSGSIPTEISPTLSNSYAHTIRYACVFFISFSIYFRALKLLKFFYFRYCFVVLKFVSLLLLSAKLINMKGEKLSCECTENVIFRQSLLLVSSDNAANWILTRAVGSLASMASSSTLTLIPINYEHNILVYVFYCKNICTFILKKFCSLL